MKAAASTSHATRAACERVLAASAYKASPASAEQPSAVTPIELVAVPQQRYALVIRQSDDISPGCPPVLMLQTTRTAYCFVVQISNNPYSRAASTKQDVELSSFWGVPQVVPVTPDLNM